MNNILIKSIKMESKGKGKGFGYSLSMSVPQLSGNLDAKLINGVFANECVDFVKFQWTTGTTVQGQHIAKGANTDKNRAVNRSLLTDVPADNKEFTKFLTKNYKKQPEVKKRIRKLRKNYRHISKGVNVIDGISKKYKHIGVFLPDPDHPAVYDSGIMRESLKGRFKPSRSYVNKSTGKRVIVSSSVYLSVRKDRQYASMKAGLTGTSAAHLVRRMNSESHRFYKSNQLIKNAIYWNDNKAAVMRGLVALRVAIRIMAWAIKT